MKLSPGCRSFVAHATFLCIVLLLQATPCLSAQDSNEDLSKQVTELRALVLKLQARLDAVEARQKPAAVAEANISPSTSTAPEITVSGSSAPVQAGSGVDLLHGTTLNLLFDGYYGYNFNRPIGRDNLLRAYEVSSNSFSLSQGAVVLENAPDPDHGKRFGARMDLQFGQATQTLQGNSANESRPDIYRNIFQLYGTYVFPVAKGITVDFGKWASSLGIEGNYNKDQLNYSRSFLFDFLPFYHTGVRANYKFNDVVTLNYWAVNGTQQTEATNGFKDQLIGFNIQPNHAVNLTVNYYLGQEHPDVIYYPNGAPAGAPANLPTLQGEPFQPIRPALTGKLHIFDSYVSWQTTPKLSLSLEGDYVVQRDEPNSAPQHDLGTAGYIRYQLTPRVALATRAEYLSDRGGLFSGANQALKEITLTTEYKFAEGFLARGEFRRDASNHPYFLTDELGILKKEQSTATLGLIWWFGPKTGSW